MVLPVWASAAMCEAPTAAYTVGFGHCLPRDMSYAPKRGGRRWNPIAPAFGGENASPRWVPPSQQGSA